VLVGVFVGVLVGVDVGVFVGVFVAVLVGVLVGVFVAVLVGVAVGVGFRHEPFTHNSAPEQQVVPQGVVPATQVQRRRPVTSGGVQVPEQQVESRRHV
jgi:Na+/citrate or Na+/malate symporter